MATRERLIFTGHDGSSLAGLLESPDPADGPARGTALFAHCFTCGKDIAAASRISRALVGHGYRVLRFDFTGLGGSDGDFANTSFSSNVDDLVAAAAHLRTLGHAPDLLIGHSLGGTAVLNAAHSVPECRGVVTIGAPADARHVERQFGCDIDRIETEGRAEVSLAGRPFTISREFLDDIRASGVEHLATLDAALLILHAPADTVVGLHEAERIYRAARHPKSFVSLSGADHLLTRAADVAYVASLVAVWASRLLPALAAGGVESLPASGIESRADAGTGTGTGTDLDADDRPSVAAGEVRIVEDDHRFRVRVLTDTHRWFADEPEPIGGDIGPDPYEHLLAALGTCTAMTLRMYAARKKLPLDDVSITLEHSREHASDCEDCDENSARIEVLTRRITLTGALDDSMRASLMRIADRCPVHRTLEGELVIRTEETPGSRVN